MSIEEVETLNPHFKWNWRKQKRRVMSQAKKLANGTYAMGCRGHPGIIQNKIIRPQDIHGSDLDIVSLLDGAEESCSIYHCCPTPISKEWALWLSRPFNYEVSCLYRALWWLYHYDDFDEHYTKDQHIESYVEYRKKVDRLFALSVTKEDNLIIEKLQKSYDDLVAGDRPQEVNLGYSGETFRYHRGLDDSDFATPSEMAELFKMRDYNYKNNIRYKKL